MVHIVFINRFPSFPPLPWFTHQLRGAVGKDPNALGHMDSSEVVAIEGAHLDQGSGINGATPGWYMHWF